MNAVEIEGCRNCRMPEFISLMSLGEQYLSDFVEKGREGIKGPLDLVMCQNCKLVQLKHTLNRDLIYHRTYWYRSGISQTIKDDLAGIVRSVESIADIKHGDTVIDIGCSDGTLLDCYSDKSLNTVGFEPASNVGVMAKEKGHRIFYDYFGFRALPPARVITAVAMFYDLDDPHGFLRDITDMLADDGVFIVQQNYLGAMMMNYTFDNIGHEHLCYYSYATMHDLVRQHGLDIFRAEYNDINGGSFRLFMQKDGGPYQMSSYRVVEEKHLEVPSFYETYAKEIEKMMGKLFSFITQEVAKGKTVAIYGASNRGNVILQHLGLNSDFISFATDGNTWKHGLYTVGTNIPIVSKEEARKRNPDYFFLSPYHLTDEIKGQETEWLDKGGKFIVPIPHPCILGKDGVMPL